MQQIRQLSLPPKAFQAGCWGNNLLILDFKAAVEIVIALERNRSVILQLEHVINALMMVTAVEATNVLAKSVKVGVFTCPKIIKIIISYNT